MITIIDLNIVPCECGICGVTWEEARSAPMWGVARYEDMAVPDDYKGEWGGMQVCRECYLVEREMRKLHPEGMISFGEILLADCRRELTC